jgi:hypothetical protein
LPLVLEVQEVPPQVRFRDRIGRLPRMIGQLSDSAEVSVDGPLGLPVSCRSSAIWS